MALRHILSFPDPRLRKRALSVSYISDEVRRIADDMLETMYEAQGIGLAAIQINVPKRIIVLDISENKDRQFVLINPEVIESEGKRAHEEGCLSIPDAYATVTRADKIKVNALNRDGKKIEFYAESLLATCIQHEIDHLEGKLFVDYLSNLKRQRIKTRLKKYYKQQL